VESTLATDILKKLPHRGWKALLLLASLCFVVLWTPVVGCSGEPRLGVTVKGKTVEVIDMHFHPGEWDNIPPATRNYLASRFPFPLSLTPKSLAESVLNAEGILGEMDKAGAAIGVLFAVYAPKTVGVATNEFVQQEVAKNRTRLLGLASLRVDRWNTDKDKELAALRKALSDPSMVGIKLAHAHMHFRMDDPRYYGIYEISAQMKKPVYLHTGSSPFPNINTQAPYTDPSYLEDAIRKHPKAIFILGHLGFDFIHRKQGKLDECIRLAKTYKNVYLEPSALGSETSDPDGSNFKQTFEKMKAQGVTDRIIYGSDGPQSPGFAKRYLEGTIRAMERANYTVDEIKAVLAGNFRRVFTLPSTLKKAP
jgi:predicted TIM-barrel fold metal-dependent hydrolase